MRALLLCGALLAVGCLSAEEEVVVRIKSGEIRGKQAEADGQPLTVFLGIPYAEPPIGELRFRRPRPVGPWTQPREAKAFSSACHQNGRMFDIEDYLENKSFSEDCLYLNVWSPAGSEDSPKAVMVWIHGGGLLVGSASEHYYRGDILATKGDVVVVSMNYRSGNGRKRFERLLILLSED
jgi:carboxylesterase type B